VAVSGTPAEPEGHGIKSYITAELQPVGTLHNRHIKVARVYYINGGNYIDAVVRPSDNVA